jgi:hypothetical protein
MTSIYHEGNRALQDLFDTRRMADRLDEAIVHDVIAPDDRDSSSAWTCSSSPLSMRMVTPIARTKAASQVRTRSR